MISTARVISSPVSISSGCANVGSGRRRRVISCCVIACSTTLMRLRGAVPRAARPAARRARPASHHRRDRVRIGHLALVGQQRVDLAVDRGRDVDVVGRVVAPDPQPELVDGAGLEALVLELGMRPAVAGVGVDRADGGLARREMVGVARVEAIPVAIGRLRRAPGSGAPADHAGDVAAQLERRLRRGRPDSRGSAVRDADDRPRRPAARPGAAAPSPPAGCRSRRRPRRRR